MLVKIFALVGGFISRWHGGGFFNAPKFLKALIWAIPFAIVTLIAHDQVGNFFAVPIAFAVLFWTMLFKNTGHGGGMDLGTNPKEPNAGRDPEKLEHLILWAHKMLPRYFYDLLLLSVIGLFSVAGAGLTVALVNPLAGAIIMLGGLAKPIGYAIGWKLYNNQINAAWPEIDEPTEIGEALTGVGAYACLALAWMVL